ncbi:MAG: ATP-binding protein [Lachnospiraceae bacterium]|nr:ATP-binding protein [Lachnospiraceae bacterium]MBQ7777073.1 ATP-binding protein [Lachnospiraceae bacterium]
MKKKINIRIVSLALVAILATMFFVIITFNELFGQQMMADLKLYSKFLQSYDSIEDISQMAANMEADELRITILDAEGRVLLDSHSDVEEMDNHANRPEIVDAMEKGEGEAIRRSDTLDKSTYYYAVRREDGSIWRISRDANSIFHFIAMVSPSLIGIIVALSVMSLVVANFLTKNLVKPIEQLAENLEECEEVAYYEEMEPFIKMIKEQHVDILKNAKMRQEFTANVTHELKTPLTSISGYAELIETGMASEKDVTRFAQGIRTNANRLLSLINDILRLSELDSTEEEMEKEQVNLYQLAATCVEMLEHSAGKHKVTLHLQGEDCFVNGNSMMLDELLYNLCDNGIRYNKENGKVTIDVHEEEEKVVLTVSDTGIGIPKGHQERIFERFYRVDKSHSKSTGGTGLGLAIVKHIVAKHGAQIELISESGEGTTMKVTFPKE